MLLFHSLNILANIKLQCVSVTWVSHDLCTLSTVLYMPGYGQCGPRSGGDVPAS